MKQFLEDLRIALKKHHLTASNIDEIIADHVEMINEAIKEGLSEVDIANKFGHPDDLAKAIAEDEGNAETKEDQTNDFALWKSFEVDKVPYKVVVKVVSEHVTYRPSADGKIHVYYKGRGKLDTFEIDYKADVFTLKAPSRSGFTFFTSLTGKLDFIIELPTDKTLELLKHTSVNGNFTYGDGVAEALEIKMVNGKTKINNAVFTSAKWNTVNGDVIIENLKSKTLNSSQVSGDMTITRAVIEETIGLNTVSGKIDIHDSTCNQCHLHAVSGNVMAKEFYPDKIALSSVSGNISIENQKKHDINILHKKTISGDIKIKPGL